MKRIILVLCVLAAATPVYAEGVSDDDLAGLRLMEDLFPLILAAKLAEEGGDLNALGEDGLTPLHRVVSEQGPFFIKMLLDAGADVNARGKDGATALHLAAFRPNPEIIALLLDAGADVNAKDISGWTPLHSAVLSDSEKNILLLLDAGADIHARDEDGLTPGDWAADNEFLLGTEALRRLEVDK